MRVIVSLSMKNVDPQLAVTATIASGASSELPPPVTRRNGSGSRGGHGLHVSGAGLPRSSRGSTRMTIRRPDPVDEQILRLLVRNSRATWREIDDKVGLSANAAAQRVRRLEQDGWIRGYTALLEPALTGPTSSEVVLISTATHVANAQFENALVAVPEVVEVLELEGRAKC
jgi:hypothetical protein